MISHNNEESLIFSTPQRVPASQSGSRPMTMDSPNLSPIVSDPRPSPIRPYSAGTSTMLAHVGSAHVTTPLTASARRLQQKSMMLPGIEEETSNNDGSMDPKNNYLNARIHGRPGMDISSLSSAPIPAQKPPRHVSNSNGVNGVGATPSDSLAVIGDDLGMKSLSLREKEKTRGGSYNRDFPIVTHDQDPDNSLNSISLLEDFNNAEEIPHHSIHRSLLEDPMHLRGEIPANEQNDHTIPLPQSIRKSHSKPTVPISDSEEDRAPLDQYYHQMKRRENQRLIEDVRKRWSKYADASAATVSSQKHINSIPETPPQRSQEHVVEPQKVNERGNDSRRSQHSRDAIEHSKEDFKKIRIALYPNTDNMKKHVKVVYDMSELDKDNLEEEDKAEDRLRPVASSTSDEDREIHSHSRTKSRSQNRSRSPSNSRRSSPLSSPKTQSKSSSSSLPVGSMYALILDKNQNPVLVPVLSHTDKRTSGTVNLDIGTSYHHGKSSSEYLASFRDEIEGSDEEVSGIHYGDKPAFVPKNLKKRTSSSTTTALPKPEGIQQHHYRTTTSSSRQATVEASMPHDINESILDTEVSFLPGGALPREFVSYPPHHHQIHSDAKRVKFDPYNHHNTSSILGDDSSTSLQSISFISRPVRKSAIQTPSNHGLVKDRFHYFPINPATTTTFAGQSQPPTQQREPVSISEAAYLRYDRPFVNFPINMNDGGLYHHELSPAGGVSSTTNNATSIMSRLPWRSLNAEILTPSSTFNSPPIATIGPSTDFIGGGDSLIESRDLISSQSILGSGALGRHTGSNTKAWRSKLIKREMTSVLNSPHMSKY